MVFWAEVEFALESAVCVHRGEVQLFLCVPSVSVDSLRCHFGKVGSHLLGFDEAMPGVILSQPSTGYALQTQHPASSLLGLWRKVI